MTGDELNHQIGIRLRWRRRVLQLTQADVAATVGATFQQIHKYEAATNALSATRLWRLAQALGVPISYFFD